MLEPHAANEPIHTVRSFLIHIAAIAVGLLLALVLEQTVGAIHHAHQRRGVETQMREVLSSNVKLAARNFGTLRSMRSYLLDLRTDIIAHLRSSGERRQSTAADSFSAPNITLPSLAPYEAAQKDGTVAIMGADRILRPRAHAPQSPQPGPRSSSSLRISHRSLTAKSAFAQRAPVIPLPL